MTTLTLSDLVRAGPSATPITLPPWLNRLARAPAIRLLPAIINADNDLQVMMTNPGYQTIIGLLNHPAAEQIIVDQDLLYGQGKGLSGLGSLFRSSKYGIKFDSTELLPGLSDVLSTAAGMPIDAGALTPEEALAILDSYMARKAEAERTDGNVAVAARTRSGSPDPCDELCEIACRCLTARGGARTYQQCVADELKRRHYSGGRPNANGPRPEVSYRRDADGTYQPVMSQNDPQFPTNAPVVPGAPRPDVSWWRDGRLWKIFEMKFPGDGHTPAQADGTYERIAEHQNADLQELDVGRDCDCKTGQAKPGVC
jgi:hypothetical protein